MINAQSMAIVPKKPRSSSSQPDQGSLDASRTSSPVPHDGKLSRTSDSSRHSFEKNRALRMFRSGSVSDNGHSFETIPSLPHKRSQSQHSNSRKQSMSAEDDGRLDVSLSNYDICDVSHKL